MWWLHNMSVWLETELFYAEFVFLYGSASLGYKWHFYTRFGKLKRSNSDFFHSWEVYSSSTLMVLCWFICTYSIFPWILFQLLLLINPVSVKLHEKGHCFFWFVLFCYFRTLTLMNLETTRIWHNSSPSSWFPVHVQGQQLILLSSLSLLYPFFSLWLSYL